MMISKRDKIAVVGGILSIAIISIIILNVVGFPDGNSDNRDKSVEKGDNRAGESPEIARITRPTATKTNGVFIIDGEVDIEVRGYEINYDRVMFCVYDSDGTVLYSKALGSIQNNPPPSHEEFDQEYRINVSFENRPAYIVVDHPKLRTDSRFGLNEYARAWTTSDPNRYTVRGISTLKKQFGFPRTNQTGKCG